MICQKLLKKLIFWRTWTTKRCVYVLKRTAKKYIENDLLKTLKSEKKLVFLHFWLRQKKEKDVSKGYCPSKDPHLILSTHLEYNFYCCLATRIAFRVLHCSLIIALGWILSMNLIQKPDQFRKYLFFLLSFKLKVHRFTMPQRKVSLRDVRMTEVM